MAMSDLSVTRSTSSESKSVPSESKSVSSETKSVSSYSQSNGVTGQRQLGDIMDQAIVLRFFREPYSAIDHSFIELGAIYLGRLGEKPPIEINIILQNGQVMAELCQSVGTGLVIEDRTVEQKPADRVGGSLLSGKEEKYTCRVYRADVMRNDSATVQERSEKAEETVSSGIGAAWRCDDEIQTCGLVFVKGLVANHS